MAKHESDINEIGDRFRKEFNTRVQELYFLG